MLGRQDAEFVRATFGAGLITAKSPGAAADVAGQGVVGGLLVVLSIVMVAPQRRRQAVTELGAGFEACVGRAVKGLKDLQGFQLWHGCSLRRLASYSAARAL